MSQVDDILFAPIENDPSWLVLTNQVVQYLDLHADAVVHMPDKYPVNRQRPPGALLLIDLMRAYHVDGIERFWVVASTGRPDARRYMYIFNGVISFGRYENREYPCLINQTGRSIRDLNLYPNRYNNAFIFADKNLAIEYQITLP